MKKNVTLEELSVNAADPNPTDNKVTVKNGGDYAYTASRFHLIQLPATVEKALLSASRVLSK